MGAKPISWMMTGAGKPFVPMEFEIGTLAPDEVLVEIAGCGVCHTDLGYYYDGVRTKHELPLALGHEISGHVVDTGADALWFTDRAVIIPAVIPCGQCDACKRGKATICPNQKMPGNDIDGGFASHIVVPSRGLCEVDETRLRKAGLALADVSIVADALTTPFQAVRRAGVAPGSLAIDVDAEKLAAVAAHGAALTLDARAHDGKAMKAAINAFAKANGLKSTEWIIFECSGTAAGQLTAYGLLVHGATLSVVGFTMDKVEVRLSNLMAFDAKAIGNWGCPPELYPAALDLMLDGKVSIKPFVEARPLDTINEVFAAVHHKDIKERVVLTP